jgi:hypothetical protein
MTRVFGGRPGARGRSCARESRPRSRKGRRPPRFIVDADSVGRSTRLLALRRWRAAQAGPTPVSSQPCVEGNRWRSTAQRSGALMRRTPLESPSAGADAAFLLDVAGVTSGRLGEWKGGRCTTRARCHRPDRGQRADRAAGANWRPPTGSALRLRVCAMPRSGQTSPGRAWGRWLATAPGGGRADPSGPEPERQARSACLTQASKSSPAGSSGCRRDRAPKNMRPAWPAWRMRPSARSSGARWKPALDCWSDRTADAWGVPDGVHRQR